MWCSPKDCALARQHTRAPYINANEDVQSPALLSTVGAGGMVDEAKAWELLGFHWRPFRTHQAPRCCPSTIPALSPPCSQRTPSNSDRVVTVVVVIGLPFSRLQLWACCCCGVPKHWDLNGLKFARLLWVAGHGLWLGWLSPLLT